MIIKPACRGMGALGGDGGSWHSNRGWADANILIAMVMVMIMGAYSPPDTTNACSVGPSLGPVLGLLIIFMLPPDFTISINKEIIVTQNLFKNFLYHHHLHH